ncbi:MAG: Ppx/GppA family phosphatase [Solirubrobacteraceae bacterium]|jgi:exopolyphosphatase/guanosine-5'-triphosphate,3'-diphosphate pyrophosphatase
MRVAIIDIGTNSTRLLIAEVRGGRVVAELERQTRVTRLGVGVDAAGKLREDAIERVFAVVDEYRARIDSLEGTAHAVLTSAVRDASNGREFSERLARRYALDAHVLSGDEEARLTYLGATSDRSAADSTGTTLVIDIGGGSTELILGTGAEIGFHVSTQTGVVRQSERHIHHDPPTDQELAAVGQDVRGVFEAAVGADRRGGVARALAVAGTPTSLAAIAQALDPYDPSRTHGYVLSSSERDRIFEELRRMTFDQRQAVKGLQPARAGVILPGIVILAELMNLFGLDRIEVSEHDILRGAAIALSATTHG